MIKQLIIAIFNFYDNIMGTEYEVSKNFGYICKTDLDILLCCGSALLTAITLFTICCIICAVFIKIYIFLEDKIC